MMSNNRAERVLIGRRLQEARVTAHISVADAAESLGVQPLAIERWERGAAMPSLIDFKRVLELYGVMPADVLFGASQYELPPHLASELAQHAKGFSSGLRSRIDCFLALFARGKEPVFKKAA